MENSKANIEIYLNVPFAEKDEAKQLGAKWDPDSRRWYVPKPLSVRPFDKWVEVEED